MMRPLSITLPNSERPVFPGPTSRPAFQAGPSRSIASLRGVRFASVLPALRFRRWTPLTLLEKRGALQRYGSHGHRWPPQKPSRRIDVICLGSSSVAGPIRPTSRHISIPPHCGLIRDAVAARFHLGDREWFRAFAECSFSTYRLLPLRGVRRLLAPSSFTDALASV